MAVTSSGTKGQPQFGSSGNTPDFAADLTALSDFFAARALRRFTTVALLGSASGAANGDWAIATDAPGALYFSNGTNWLLANIPAVGSQSARNALFSGTVIPAAGDEVFRTDLALIQRYNGSAWKTLGSGLVSLIPASAVNGTVGAAGVVTFTTQSAISLNSVFSADFDTYLISVDLSTSSTGTNITLKLRNAGTDVSSGYQYGLQDSGFSSGTATAVNSASDSSMIIGRANGSTPAATDVKLFRPFLAQTKGAIINCVEASRSRIGGGVSASATANDGFTLGSSSGTISGNVRVYGVANN